IYLVIRNHGEARSKEIMKRLGVSGPSVTEALQLLAEKKLVNYQPYEAITLTPEGEEVAKDVLHRHETLRDFFIEVLGVDAETADKGACKMEHAASPEIIERMIKYTHFLNYECERCGNKREHGFTEFLQQQEK
ncbi:MAG TPA: metal-dependent transcriptional regulator, partial [Desulfobulbus sp.]|nr:metal-dependent transcriptional regulator [Desulfobulbus sp.]